jgi:hypothetical protein
MDGINSPLSNKYKGFLKILHKEYPKLRYYYGHPDSTIHNIHDYLSVKNSPSLIYCKSRKQISYLSKNNSTFPEIMESLKNEIKNGEPKTEE